MEPREKYEDSKKKYRDIKNCMDTAFEEGKIEGKEEGLKLGKIEGIKKGRTAGLKEGKIKGVNLGKMEGQKAMIIDIIRKGVSKDISIETLTDLTGLTENEVLNIISTLGNDDK
jgi:flagellar biosynthesis/type III secretory pathway protein FliH